MAELSVEDKSKGKRIVTQFFRTMPAVQKSLMTVFDRDGYEGVYRIQSILYPENSSEIRSIDMLRKGLSMILQHIYGMPVEDKEGYFQDIVKCRTASQVVRKEKETLLNHFYHNLGDVKKYLLSELIEDQRYRFSNKLGLKFFEEAEKISDMRGFKNQIRLLYDVMAERIDAGMSEEELVGLLKQYKQEMEQEAKEQAANALGANGETLNGEALEKQQIILQTLTDAKYQGIRNLLLKKTLVDPNFAIFQQYLDNILSPSTSTRFVANDLHTFSEGVKKIKDFRDSLERELSA